MGKIKYDFYTNPNVNSENSKSDYHIRVCGQQTISTKGIIELIHNASTLTPADINAVIFAFQEEIANQLAKGNIVKLEGLCSFNISLKSANGTCTGKETGKAIEVKSVNINPEKEFTEMVKELVTKNGMEKVMARHSDSVSDEKVDRILTNYFSNLLNHEIYGHAADKTTDRQRKADKHRFQEPSAVYADTREFWH